MKDSGDMFEPEYVVVPDEEPPNAILKLKQYYITAKQSNIGFFIIENSILGGRPFHKAASPHVPRSCVCWSVRGTYYRHMRSYAGRLIDDSTYHDIEKRLPLDVSITIFVDFDDLLSVCPDWNEHPTRRLQLIDERGGDLWWRSANMDGIERCAICYALAPVAAHNHDLAGIEGGPESVRSEVLFRPGDELWHMLYPDNLSCRTNEMMKDGERVARSRSDIQNMRARPEKVKEVLSSMGVL